MSVVECKLLTEACHCRAYIPGGIPTRLHIAAMLFFACFFSYMLRVNMSINLLAMVNHYDVNGTLIAEPDVR